MVMRLFMMKYFRLSVEEFDKMPNPHNCEAWVLKRNSVGEYVLHEKLHLPQETLWKELDGIERIESWFFLIDILLSEIKKIWYFYHILV